MSPALPSALTVRRDRVQRDCQVQLDSVQGGAIGLIHWFSTNQVNAVCTREVFALTGSERLVQGPLTSETNK